jgi:hypothetical protein
MIELLGMGSRSGCSEALAEGVMPTDVRWTAPMASSLRQAIDPFIAMPVGSQVRYLTRSEQRIMKRALLRSTRLVSRG